MKTKTPVLLGIVGVISTQLFGVNPVLLSEAVAASGAQVRAVEPIPCDVAPASSLFFDNFSRSTSTNLLAPWRATQTNTWTVADGTLQGSTARQSAYTFAYLTNAWKDYSVEARLCFSSTSAWGGGLGGRLDPSTGSHYAAWVYPEGSPGGSNLLKLVKFQNWTTFGSPWANYLPMQQVSLGEVGTNWHTLKLTFQANQITVAYDGAQLISLFDPEPLLYRSGAISLGLWTELTPFTMSVDDVAVSTAGLLPLAADDSYSLAQGQALRVPDPGILQNDCAGEATNLSAVLVTAPANGALTLNPDGGFCYTPAVNFVGTDSFTYQANNGQTNAAPATVVLLVSPRGTLAYDDFSRPTAPGPLSPWIAHSGNWTMAEGVLQGGTTQPQSYGFTYLPASWTNYEVEVPLRFSASNAWGGGIGGRLDPVTGAHYAAWVYPEGAAGGSNVIKLIKFQNWERFGYTTFDAVPMQQASIKSVGTNWHTLKLAFQANQITVAYDGEPLISIADLEPPVYASGAVALEMWSDLKTYSLLAQSVTVKPLPALESPVQVQSISVSNGLTTLRWNAVAGRNYQIQYKDDLQQTNWNVLEPVVSATYATFNPTNTASSAKQRFFRVVPVP